MKKLFKLILSKSLFTRVLFALFVSGLGTAFTSVAVYEQLALRSFGPLGFALAYAAGLLPGMITSYFSGRYYRRWRLGKILVMAQIAGLLMLIFPLFSSFNGSIVWLLLAEVAASAVGGLLIPIYKTIERSSFKEEELPALSVLDTFLLTANFICGQGLGALLASAITLRQFLSVDAISYLLAIIILWPLMKEVGATDEQAKIESDLALYRRLNAKQKQALWMLPWLAFVCAPLMVLLPARGSEFIDPKLFGILTMTSALFLICSRTLGQLLGPLAAAKLNLQILAEKNGSLSLALLAYILLYIGAYQSSSIYLVAAFCILAHICSNIVYAVGTFQVMKVFSPAEVGWAFSFIYRIVTLVVGLSGLFGGVLAQGFGFNVAILISVVGWALGVTLLFFLSFKSTDNVCSQ